MILHRLYDLKYLKVKEKKNLTLTIFTTKILLNPIHVSSCMIFK